MEKEITIHNNLSEITRITQFTKELDLTLQLPSSIALSIGLSVEEAVSSIIRHAYPDSKQGEINLKASFIQGEITFLITDNGISFDPTLAKNTSVSAPLEETLYGGLGFYLILRTMDEVAYHTVGNQNFLMLTKRINTEEGSQGSMNTNICKVGSLVILTIEGRLDTINARKFETVIQALLIDIPQNIILNCEKLTYISSSGIRSFILLQKCITKCNGRLTLEGMRPEIRKIFDMTGCSSVFNIR